MKYFFEKKLHYKVVSTLVGESDENTWTHMNYVHRPRSTAEGVSILEDYSLL